MHGDADPARRGAATILAGVVACDQLLKFLVERSIPLGADVVLIPGAVTLTHVRNPGVAFSLLREVPLLVPAAIAVFLLVMLFSTPARWTRRPYARLALALLAGGAVGNLIDRVRVGAVIDYVDLHVWPVFNLADAAVTAGTLLLLAVVARGPAAARAARRRDVADTR